MIALGVGIAAMAVLIAGILLEYTIEQDRIGHIRDESIDTQTARIREDIHAKFNDTGITIQNRWSDTSTITAIVIVCDNNTIRSSSYTDTVPVGQTIDAPILQDINALRRSCP